MDPHERNTAQEHHERTVEFPVARHADTALQRLLAGVTHEARIMPHLQTRAQDSTAARDWGQRGKGASVLSLSLSLYLCLSLSLDLSLSTSRPLDLSTSLSLDLSRPLSLSTSLDLFLCIGALRLGLPCRVPFRL